ncbi:MAG: RNA-binding protein [Clostridia bacterium]|nr:RNA-binding protein [Clostridia bacterium]
MGSTSKCQYCEATLSSNDKQCPSCGAPNPNYVEVTPRKVIKPTTIEELKEYCAERGMPLLRMRFFIDEDYKQPRAFGIYRDGDKFVVYKNKSDGSRAIRYSGPDEAYAVNELYMKLLSECHNRGIYPDGKPDGTRSAAGENGSAKPANKWVRILQTLTPFVAFGLIILIIWGISSCVHRNDGYYDFNDGKVWYLHGSDWFYTFDNDSNGDWYDGTTPPVTEEYGDYYQGSDFDSDWGVSNFMDSDTYDYHYGSDSDSDSGSDYGGWDSSDTDWGSDW